MSRHVSDRPTLILLPALPCDGEFYAGQIKALSDLVDPKVMVLDEASMARSAAAVLAGAPPRFLLAGTAYGGCLAIEVAVRAPDRIAGLWLMNCHPGAHPNPGAAARLCARVRAGEYEAVLSEWARIIVAKEAVTARDRYLAMARAAGPDRFARQYEASANRADHWDDLKRITAPTLLLWGEDDRFVPIAVGKRMAKEMPGAQFVTLPGCRHFPPLEKPEATISAARNWLAAALSAPAP
jgi:pimeloyl-ACP methyl ester carboxylesterase